MIAMARLKDLVIYGTGGMGRETHELVEDVNADEEQWSLLGFLDDTPTQRGADVHGCPVLGDSSWLQGRRGVAVVVAIGAPALRRRVVAECRRRGVEDFPKLIHPSAWIGRRVSVGSGAIICAGVSVTTDAVLGEHVILNVHAAVAHDTVVGDFVTLAPGVNVSGRVRIGEGCDLGTGSVVIQGISVGAWSVVGAGAAVVDDLPSNVTAVGVPAKVIRQHGSAAVNEADTCSKGL